MAYEPKCPVRGHDHNLNVVKTHFQQGTGHEAVTLECPTGYYRWFQQIQPLLPFSDGTRQKRPRFGWR